MLNCITTRDIAAPTDRPSPDLRRGTLAGTAKTSVICGCMNSAGYVLRLSFALVWLPLAGLKSAAWGQVSQGAASAGTSPAKPRIACQVDTDPPSDAEKALSRRDYKAALELFQQLESSSPDVSRAGVIRTLLEEGELQHAVDQAKSWQEAVPDSGSAMETWAEVLYRNGELPEALKTVLEARKLDPCNARALLMTYRIENLLGNHATAARQITAAHTLAPHELEVEEAWTNTLRRSQRLEIETTFAKDEGLLNAKDRNNLLESLAHEKDYSKSDCQLVQPAENAEIHMEEMMEDSTHRRSFGLYVKLNGSQRTLEMDSGASGITLSRAAAARLKLAHDEKFVVSGVGDEGGIQSAVAHVESIRIGGLEFKNCPVTILEKNDKLGIDGLIGTDFFSKYLVTLDFPGKQVRLSPLPKRPGETTEDISKDADDTVPVFHDRYIAPEMKDWTMVWRDGHYVLLPVSIGGAKDKLFLVDTGAESMLISPVAAREVTKVHGDFDTHMFGISGEVKHVYQTQEFLVTFAHVRLHVDSMTAIDTNTLSKDEGIELSGILGAPVLNRLVLQIDYRDNLVNLNYDQKKDPQNLAPTPFY
jgi:predicted aspartyl protease